MATSPSKDRVLAARQLFTPTVALPPPYQHAIENTEFRLTILDNHTAREHDCERVLAPATWFSITLTAPTSKRYLYLVQEELATRCVVLLMLFDRHAIDDGRPALRMPPSGAWLRAIVEGPVYVLASDLVLSRKAITAWSGGREPPSMPPYT